MEGLFPINVQSHIADKYISTQDVVYDAHRLTETQKLNQWSESVAHSIDPAGSSSV